MSQVDEKKFRIHRYFSAVLIFLFFSCLGNTTGLQNRLLEVLPPDKLVLFIVKYDNLICSPCLNSFLDFYLCLPYPSRENMVWGIIVYDNPEEKERREVYRRIVEKKSRGFFKANNITCPVVLDHSHGFKIFSKKGTAILLFERENRILKKYDFPLNEKQKKEILNFFNDSGQLREGDN